MTIEKLRPRLCAAILIGIVVRCLLPSDWRETTRLLIAWDGSLALYLTLIFIMFVRSDTTKIQYRAGLQDEGKFAILLLVTVSALASIAAIVAELAAAKAQTQHIQWSLVGLTGLTVLLSWSFLHTSFALHYAHEFYDENEGALMGGLDFPGDKHPDYWDFVYYSFIIGTAAATADVNITSKNIRKVTTLHCILAFFFNTTILGLTVNIAAGLF